MVTGEPKRNRCLRVRRTCMWSERDALAANKPRPPEVEALRRGGAFAFACYPPRMAKISVGGGGQWITVNGVHIHIGEGGKPDEGPKAVIQALKKEKPASATTPAPQAAPEKEPTLRPGQSTEEKHRDIESGKWSQERHSLHENIMQNLFKERKGGEEKPQAYLLGGGSASGKSTTFIKQQEEDFLKRVLKVDSDAIKEMIPEFEELKRIDPDNAAARVHEESSYLAKLAIARAVAAKLSFLYDSTGSSKNLHSLAEKLKSEGYETNAHFYDVPIEQARERAKKRGERTGRFIPEDVLQGSHHGSAAGFMRLMNSPHVDNAVLFDTSGMEPELVYQKTGGELAGSVKSEEKWKTYRQKAGITE